MLKKILNSTLPVVVAFSGGKDSVAMVLYLLQAGVPKERIHLHHHDVDGNGEVLFDWPCTKHYCKKFAKAFGLKLFFSHRQGGIVREIFRNNQPKGDVYYQTVPGGEYSVAPAKADRLNTRLMWPAVSANLMTRWCSATAKIEVLRTLICFHPDYQEGCFVLTGERWAESTARSKYLETEVHHSNTKNREVITWRPILKWSEKQVWEIIEKFKVVPHPAYYLGWSRCSCRICIFNGPNIWASVDKIAPDIVDRVDSIETEIEHTLYHKIPIRDKVNQGTAMDMEQFWINQSNKFTLSIITDEWELPKGAYSMEKSGSV